MNRKFKNFITNVKGKATRNRRGYYQIYFELEKGGQLYHRVQLAYSEEQAIALLEDEINAGYTFEEKDLDWIILDERGLNIRRYRDED